MAIPWISLATLCILAGVVFYSRHELSQLERSSHGGPNMDMSKSKGTHWMRHVSLPSAENSDYVMREFIAAGTIGFYPGKIGSPPRHIHPLQDETFTVVKGSFSCEVNGTEHHLSEGQSYTIPKGSEHYFWSADPSKDLLIDVTMSPGLSSAKFFENFAGIMRDSDVDGRSVNPLQILGLSYEYHSLMADIPQPIREPFQKVMHKLAPFMGFKYEYAEYSSVPEVAGDVRGKQAIEGVEEVVPLDEEVVGVDEKTEL